MENQQAIEIFRKFRETHSQREVAKILSVAVKTVSRWEREESRISPLAASFLQQLISSSGRKPNPTSFTFIDLFAGVGGIRHGFESVGGQCLFTSEWNPWSKKTYQENYGAHEKWVDDIVPFPAEAVPDHDVLLAGFPCQPFSIAGVSKKNALGRPHGFECTTQGTLFFDVARIIARKRPAAFLLENVKNLVSHDKGNTLRVILQTLREDLGYKVEWKVIDGKSFVPQHRERILIAGFRQDTGFSWDDFVLPEKLPTLKDILHPEDGTEEEEPPFTTGEKSKVHKKYVLTDKLWGYLQAYSEKHRMKGNGFGFGLVGPEDRARTLSARYYKDGSEILVRRKGGGNPRRLTPRECARLMGFPDTFKIKVSDTQAYRQFGNSVVVPVMREAARIMLPHVIQIKSQEQSGLIQLPLFNWEVTHQREAV